MFRALTMIALKVQSELGAEYALALVPVINFRLLYAKQGKMAELEAEAMYLRALQGYESTVGTDHTRKECFGGLCRPHKRTASW
jgi:hypothetical protein